MIAAGIFLCLFLLLISMLCHRPWFSVILFFLALGFLLLLFMYHATDPLHLNF